MSANHDDNDRVEAGLGGATALPHRAAVGVVIVASVVVVVAFLLALGAAQPTEAVHVVVVADPHAEVGATTPVRVLGLYRQRLVPLDVVVNGAVVDADGFGRAVVAVGWRLHVTGSARVDDDDDRAVDLDVSFSTKTPPKLSTTPWTTSLAVAVAGAAVYPEDGLVPARGAARVVLVDDDNVRTVDVDAGEDARLADGRLLAVDRLPVSWRFDSDDVVVLHARETTSAVLSVFVGDRVTSMQRLDLAVGDTRWQVPLPADAARGDLVVVGLTTSLVPSAPVRKLVTRIGGLTDDDLLRVEPRAAGHLDDAVVRRALGRRLVVSRAVPTIVSPTAAEQMATAQRHDDDNADDFRVIFRGAAACQVLCLLLMAIAARPRFMTAVLAVLLVVGFDVGLDAVLGVAGSDVATSGSP